MLIKVKSLNETKTLAKRMAKACQGKNVVITLDGDLGAGKTAWTKEFGKCLGVKNTINSPTFNVVKCYIQSNNELLYHIDAYRLEGSSQDLGFREYFDDGISVIEWSQFISSFLPLDIIKISIEICDDEERIFTIRATGEESKKIMEDF